MKIRSIIFFLGLNLSVFAARKPAGTPELKEGSRMPQAADLLKSYFPESTVVEERAFLPLESGGSTLMGLISRLLGEAPRSETEGMRTRRYFYLLKGEKNKVQGVVHGSSFEDQGQRYDVYVAYSPDGIINKVWAPQFPEKVTKEFEERKIWEQFEGKMGDDLQVKRKKISRRKSVRILPVFLTQVKKPTSSEARIFFDKSLRALRFNVSFMDIAYFITQHPDLADKGGEEFPENVAITTGTPTTGPEAFVRERASVRTNPFEDNKLNILQNLDQKKN